MPKKFIKAKDLCWNVYYESMNSQKIETFNIFDHGSFAFSFDKLITDNNITKNKFIEKVKSDLMYYFWSKSEWEIVLTSWGTYITDKELCRLNEEKIDHKNKWGTEPSVLNVELTVSKKIDVWEQISINWERFVEYISKAFNKNHGLED